MLSDFFGTHFDMTEQGFIGAVRCNGTICWVPC